MKPTILVVDDEPSLRTVLSANLKREGYLPIVAADGRQALAALERETVHVVVTDLRMPGLDGLGLLQEVQARWPHVPVILITAHGTVDTAVEAMKRGAFDFVTKPFEQAELKIVIAKAVATSQLQTAEVPASAGAPGRFGIIGGTSAMHDVFGIIDRIADTPATVLITGESGTGKELVSRALHEQSSRKRKPFIRINCAAIPKDLMESELFGYEKGAFTGAVSSKPGRFELAHEGSLFLDEIGEIPVEMQVKLLRALQEQEFERVGGIRTIRVDVRLIAATNQQLEKAIAEGRFREDLYYRLNVVPIRLPPLRERREDIRPLVVHILERSNDKFRRAVKGLTDEAMASVMAYDWPGNIRELENVIERMLLLSGREWLELQDVPPEVRGRLRQVTAPAMDPALAMAVGPLKDMVKETTERLEKEFIVKALKETRGNVTRAAQILQISRKSLQNKMKEFDLREREL